MIVLTENAVSRVKNLQAQDPETAGKPLRVFVEPSGCAGYSYGFSFDSKRDGDTELAFNGLTVLVDSDAAAALKGSTIDYIEDPTQSGFKIQNPNVKKSCGCGHSFEV